jgi:hypothetical protein
MKKFLDAQTYRLMVDSWRDAKFRQEHPDALRHYMMQRIEGSPDINIDIGYLHQTAFLRGIIPEKIKEKEGKRKVRILDIGTGAAHFPDQIREQFGDAVEVYSTGLDKKLASAKRGMPLHINDIKWHSISELRDIPEFDLIIDTIGEIEYRTQRYEAYIEEVIAKLQAHGDAYLVLLYDTNRYEQILEITQKVDPDSCNITCTPGDQLIRIHIHKL